MDIITSERRSQNMRQIKSKNTTPEIMARRILHAMGYRYRLHVRDLPGKPDLVFKSRRVAIFVHGCFWHQHKKCGAGRLPKSNLTYWQKKLARNVIRDRSHTKQLKQQGCPSGCGLECRA
jgi:DNA mismatch endonuclease (patch repair protein)